LFENNQADHTNKQADKETTKLDKMGIHKLMDLLKENAPGCIKDSDIRFYAGRTVALDASIVS